MSNEAHIHIYELMLLSLKCLNLLRGENGLVERSCNE